MIPLPSVSRLWAGGIFDRPHLLAFLDFYFFYQRLRPGTLAGPGAILLDFCVKLYGVPTWTLAAAQLL